MQPAPERQYDILNSMSSFLRPLQTLATPVLAFAVATAITALLLGLGGYAIMPAFLALAHGAFGSANACAETVVRAAPLLLTGLAVAFAFRAGVWNIGAEGQFLIGALTAIALAPVLASLPAYLGFFLLLMCSASTGGLWASLAGWMKFQRQVPEVVSTILLNFIALELVRYAVNGPLMETLRQFPQTDALAPELRLTRWLTPTRLHTGVLCAPLVAGLVHAVLTRTVFGFNLRATAANATAARFAGLNVARIQLLSMAISGALAGLAGFMELTGVTYRLYQNFSPGYGYTAIAVALMARLQPVALIFSAVLFGALENGALAVQRQANVSAVVVNMMQGVVVLTIAVAGAMELKRKN